MAFANLSVLALGSLLMGIPIMLHLMMRKRPRHQLFPALRFLQHRQIDNKRQLQLRNWLLLALRLAGIGLLALLFARPSVDSVGLGYWLRTLVLGVLVPLAIVGFCYSWVHQKGWLLTSSLGVVGVLMLISLVYFAGRALATGVGSGIGDPQAPVAAVLVIDTSPRMGLRHQNRSRLDEARLMARDLLKQLPTDSEVAIVDAVGSGVFARDMASVLNLVDSLQVGGAEYPLHELVLRGVELVWERQDKRQEVYVLTELSEAAWEESRFRAVKEALEVHPAVALFVLDVGVPSPRNIQLGELRLSPQTLRKGQVLRVEVDVHSIQAVEDVSVTVSLESPDPALPVVVDGKVLLPEQVQRDRASFSLDAGATVPVAFDLTMPNAGIHHGQVRLEVEDGLSIDNARYFSTSVHPPWPALLVTGPGAAAKYVEAVISPLDLRAAGQVAFTSRVVNADQLLDERLADFKVIVLLDVDGMTLEHWQRLAEFVRDGGSLAHFMGRNAAATGLTAFNQLANALLPAPLAEVHGDAEPVYVSVPATMTAHPMLAYFRGRESTIAWDAAPIMSYWRFATLRPGCDVVATFTNGDPALIESTLGKGRIVTMATTVSDVRNDKRRPAWNYFPTSEDGFPFFALMFGMFPYLAGQADGSLNHTVNETVTISLPPDAAEDETWLLFTPQLDWQNIRSENRTLTIAGTSWPGTYRLKDTEQASSGFSVNLPARATQLRRLPAEQLDEILGANRYTLARGASELSRGIGRSRVGRELFPFLALIVVGLLGMEHLLANRFYGLAEARSVPHELPATRRSAV